MIEFIPAAEVHKLNDTCPPTITAATSWDQFDMCTKFNTTATCPTGTCMMYDLSKYQQPSTAPADPNAAATQPVNGWCKWNIPTGTNPATTADPCSPIKTSTTCVGTICSWIAA